MRKLLLATALLCPSLAFAQVLPNPTFIPAWDNHGRLPLLANTVSTCSTNQFANGLDATGKPTCATPTTGSSTAAAGSTGQFQTNSAGSLAGVTISGDFSINGVTGVGTLNTVPIAKGGTGVTSLPTGILKGAGAGPIAAAVAGTDYQAPIPYTPANRAGDTFTGAVAAPSFSGIGTGITNALLPYRPEWYANVGAAASAASGLGVGGELIFSGAYTLAAAQVLPNGQVWTGEPSGQALFTYNPGTGSAITLIGDASSLRSAALTSGASPTSSIGVQVGNGEQGQHPVVRDVVVNGFPTGIDLRSNVLRKLDNVTVNTSGVTAIRTRNTVNPDAGDDFWSGVTASNASGTGTQNVLWEGGGGLKIAGFKSLGNQIGFNVAIPDGVSTQDLQFGISSIENATVACMKFARTGTTGFLGLASITNSEFAGCPYGQWFANAGVTTAYVGSNVYSSIGSAAIRLDNGANNIVIGPNAYSTTTPIQDNRTDFNEDGYINRDMVRGFSGVTTTNRNFYQIVMPNFRAAKLTLFIEGIAQGYNSFGYSAEYILRSGSLAVALTNIYTPVTDPNSPVAVIPTLDTSTTPGSVYVGIRSSGGGITQLQGTITIKIDGKVQQVNVIP